MTKTPLVCGGKAYLFRVAVGTTVTTVDLLAVSFLWRHGQLCARRCRPHHPLMQTNGGIDPECEKRNRKEQESRPKGRTIGSTEPHTPRALTCKARIGTKHSALGRVIK